MSSSLNAAIACYNMHACVVTESAQSVIRAATVNFNSNFCVALQIDRTEPKKLETWQAHDSGIIGLQMAAHEAGVFLITASTDHTAKLWDMQGHCVGLFGQVGDCTFIE